jgi:hypothetical protein
MEKVLVIFVLVGGDAHSDEVLERVSKSSCEDTGGVCMCKQHFILRSTVLGKLGSFVLMATILLLFSSTGCSVFMAAKQPDKKDLSCLSAGTPRNAVLAELGQPIHTEMKEGKRLDSFSFTQGYSKEAKVGRAFFHGAADVFTLGLWEVVGTPTEAIFDGTKMACQVKCGLAEGKKRIMQ